jgi:hypothetical protein
MARVVFFAVVPVVVAIWDYYGFLVCRDGLYRMHYEQTEGFVG